MSEIKKRIVSKFGGTNVVAQICGVTAGAVSHWDLIPAKHQPTLFMAAKKRGIKLRAEEFMTAHASESSPQC